MSHILHNESLLIKELDTRSKIIFGENNSAEYNIKGVGDPRLALFFKLVDTMDHNELYDYIVKIVELAIDTKNPIVFVDLFVLMYQTRDIRGGKGRRILFYQILLIIYKFFPNIILNLLYLVPDYGYFKDYFNLLKIIYGDGIDHLYEPLIDKIYSIVANQLKLDAGAYENSVKESRKPLISLLAKYIPKEKKHFDKQYHFVDKITTMMYSSINDIDDRKRIYRIQVSMLNKALDTVEIKMSAKKFSEIVFSKITSNNSLKYRKAFLNINIADNLQKSIEEDRIKARENFIKTIIDNNIKGGALTIENIIKNISTLAIDSNDNFLSQDEWLTKYFIAAWTDLRKSLLERINKNILERTFNLDNLIPIVDVSGSMIGTPMMVAIGLGILVSEIGSIKNKIITFSADPQWVELDNLNIVSKVRKIITSDWGANTNFEKVYRMIIDIIRDKRLKPSDIPNIIVFSDMQFDKAVGSDNLWNTHYEIIVKEFQKVGIEISGQPYDPPMIIFWNLRGDTKGFPVMKNTSNVKMLSGYSPNLLQYVLDGNINANISEKVFDEPSLNTLKESPYIVMRRILDDDRYSPVREIVSALIKN